MCNYSKLLTDLKRMWELQMNSHVGSFTDTRHLVSLCVNYHCTFPCAILLLGCSQTELN